MYIRKRNIFITELIMLNQDIYKKQNTMSEFTNKAEFRASELAEYMLGLLQGENGRQLIEKHSLKTSKFIPQDIVNAFDILLDRDVPIEDLKFVSNKLFNILYQTLLKYPALQPVAGTVLHLLIEDNRLAQEKLKDTRELIKCINKKASPESVVELIRKLEEFSKFEQHYVVVENVLFPLMETKWEHHKCVKIMWSFHDDIRRNILKIIELLRTPDFDIKEFNTLNGLVFFNVNTIILREEKILFPMILETFPEEIMQEMMHQTLEIGLPFAKAIHPELADSEKILFTAGDKVYLPTGILSPEQFNLIFNHLPVDITFVDENDTVQFYSNPPHRIFPRTPAIIGRKVQYCHPPESVHVVDKIVESFKSGEKNVASFWLHLGSKYVLIQYFAVRNKEGEYKGTLEVSQEISEIQQITGDRKLLDW